MIGKTHIKYREDGKYNMGEISEMIDEINFNEVFVRFVFEEPCGNKKYIYAEEGEEGNVILKESEILTGNSGWIDESQVIFVVEGNSNNISIQEQFGLDIETDEDNDGNTIYIWNGERMTKEQAIDDLVENGDFHDWKMEIIEKEEMKQLEKEREEMMQDY